MWVAVPGALLVLAAATYAFIRPRMYWAGVVWLLAGAALLAQMYRTPVLVGFALRVGYWTSAAIAIHLSFRARRPEPAGALHGPLPSPRRPPDDV
jgi:hypothetical protein